LPLQDETPHPPLWVGLPLHYPSCVGSRVSFQKARSGCWLDEVNRLSPLVIRYSPDCSRFDVIGINFLDFLEARREVRTATDAPARPNGGRRAKSADQTSFGTPGTMETPGALRSPPVASGEPRRLLASTPFQSSSGGCRLNSFNGQRRWDRPHNPLVPFWSRQLEGAG